MTLPQNVKDAVERMCTPLDKSGLSGATEECDGQCMETIRAHLMSQEESITNLRSAAQKAVLANADLRVRAELAESRLAAANALLEKVYNYLDKFDPNNEIYDEVETYLQGK